MQIAKKSHFVIKAGDVIFNKLFAWKGTFGIVPPELDGMFVSDKFPTYELDRTQVDEGFLRWYFRCPPLWEQARAMSTGSAALSKLTLNPPKFLHLTMPKPPLSEQKCVVARIEELAAQVQAARETRALAVEATTALLRARLHRLGLMVGQLGVLGDVLCGPPSNGWSVRCDNSADGVPVLSLSAVTGFRYRHTEFKRTSIFAPAGGRFWLRHGDLLMTRSNTPELVGHAAIYDGSPTPCIYPDLMMRLEPRRDRVVDRFVWYWLQSPPAREFIARSAKGTSPSMKKISQSTVMKIPFPTSLAIPEQSQFVASLDALQARVDALCNLQAETAAEIDALLPAVLHAAFNGEL